jgi:hypothetical protein
MAPAVAIASTGRLLKNSIQNSTRFLTTLKQRTKKPVASPLYISPGGGDSNKLKV